MKILKALRWLFLVSGILLIIVGIWMLFTPYENLVTLAIYISIVMLISGISEIIGFFTADRRYRTAWMLVSGLVTTGISLWLLFGSGAVALAAAIPFIFAGWVMISGISRIIGSLTFKSFGYRPWVWVLVLGIIITLLGILLMFRPMLSAGIIGTMLAIIFLAFGINNVVIFANTKRFTL